MRESEIEQVTLGWLADLGYTNLHGPEIAPGELLVERDDYAQVVLEQRLRDALARLNPAIPADALDEAFRKLTRPDLLSLAANNHAFHRMLVEGVTVAYRRADGSIAHEPVNVLDFDDPANNDACTRCTLTSPCAATA